MKKLSIIALHLSYGGIEKAVTNLANLMAGDFDVTVYSVYKIDERPAYEIDSRVRVVYLLKDRPNRSEFKEACRNKQIIEILRQGFRALKVLAGKKIAVIKTIKSINEGIVITTRNEDNVLLSRFGSDNVVKIAQLHQDYITDKRLPGCFAKKYGRIDYLTVLTPRLKDEITEIMAENRRTKVVCIPNFLDKLPERTDCEREKFILSVGRLDPIKGFDRLLRIFASFHVTHPEWRLKIVGDGAEESKLKNQAEELGISALIDFCGRLGTAEIYSLMQRAGIYALASYSEALPFVLIESFACGLPAVAFDVRVGPEALITDGRDGFLIPDGDEKAYADRLSLLAEDSALRDLMGDKAAERSGDFTASKLYGCWKELL